ncbi:heat shock protein Hsp15 [Faunimonas pinastri]|uniref:Heat shock protein Hsp15 n=1 Tax=Faunimonas pinastri TaxID=1855383 RepID=A0A1H9C8S2_9HYPH|nr:RNA-binding S4 domain-containing protein [Faunimonas pinastri]SEP97562.1 heat shock protein Hsp15 [Faunimonas pinastri]
MTEGSPQRIDKWLWHARFVKTRTGAQKLAVSGDVRVNREKVSSASRLVHAGDVLTIATDQAVRVIHILGISERRGPFDEARLLYRDASTPGREASSEPLEQP